MKLSIITVNLNNAVGLEKTAESIVSQTFTDFEWIVIDGGSTDGSVDVIRKYEDHIAYWVSEKDSGIYNAMNKGVKIAKGEYVQFLNSGDWLAESRVLDEIFTKNRHDEILYGDVLYVNGKKVCEKKSYPKDITISWLLTDTICHQSIFIPKILQERFPYNENLRFSSDYEFLLKALLKSAKFKHVDIFVCGFDINGISRNPSCYASLYSEADSVRNRLLPECILREYKDGCNGELLRLRKSHRLYSKFITATILIMRCFDSIFRKI